MTYCFKCPECQERAESGDRDAKLICPSVPHHCGRREYMVRDYGAEGAAVDRGSLRRGVNLDRAPAGSRRSRAPRG